MFRSIQDTAKALVAPGKGILAADESVASMNKRLKKIGAPETSETAREFRELLFTAPDIEKYLTGVILFDETLRQSASTGQTFPHLLESRGIMPGIKVDRGLVPLPFFAEEEISEGLDGLSARLREYYEHGARFTKWRSAFAITEETPSEGAVAANCHVLARYAALSQEANMVPIVEPEVLFAGTHTIEESGDVIRGVLQVLFDTLALYRVAFDGLILKTSMVLPGASSGTPLVPMDVARETVAALKDTVPPSVAGVVFLSGGQSPQQALDNLQAIAGFKNVPWPLTFSYSRALQEPALDEWRGMREHAPQASQLFIEQLAHCAAAREGAYTKPS